MRRLLVYRHRNPVTNGGSLSPSRPQEHHVAPRMSRTDSLPGNCGHRYREEGQDRLGRTRWLCD